MTDTPAGQHGDERLRKVEEVSAYTAHEAEQLHEALLDLADRLGALDTRLRQLERRLDRADAAAEGAEDPEQDA